MSRRALLSAQLAQLGAPSADPDARDVEQLGAVNQDDTEEVERDREHYLDVGPSRLRKGEVEQTLLSDKYGGQVRRRQKIFEDDEDESGDEGEGSGSEDGDSEEEEADEEDEDDDDDDDGGDEDDEDDEDDDEADEEEEDDEDDGASAEVGDGAPSNPVPSTTTASRTLDPLASLREARSKDVLKGQAIKRQRVSLPPCLPISSLQPLHRQAKLTSRGYSKPSPPSASHSKKPSPLPHPSLSLLKTTQQGMGRSHQQRPMR